MKLQLSRTVSALSAPQMNSLRSVPAVGEGGGEKQKKMPLGIVRVLNPKTLNPKTLNPKAPSPKS